MRLIFPNFPLHNRLLPILTRMSSSKPYTKDSTPRDRRRRNNPNDSPSVALSKQLSWLLRHGLDKSGLPVRNDGYVQLDAVVPLLTDSISLLSLMCLVNLLVVSPQVSSVYALADKRSGRHKRQKALHHNCPGNPRRS